MKKFTIAIFFSFYLNVCFSNDSCFTIKKINIIGNKKTKDFIILRELTFKIGDTICQWQQAKETSRKQIINLFLFNEITIDKTQNGDVNIQVKERWYVWPFPVLEYADRNINQWWLTKDPKRLVYGIEFKWYNFRGRNETILLDFKTGYTQLFNLTYKVPFFNAKKTWGMQLTTGISANREVWYKTEQDKLQFFKANNLFLINRNYGEIIFTHRKKILNYHQFYGGLKNINVKDTILSDSVNNQFLRSKNNQQQEIYLGYQFIRDKRDVKGYPLKGHYIKANIEGPFFIQNAGILVKLSAAKYLPISKRLYSSAIGTFRYFNLNNIPYSKIQALGYGREYIRGYELNVIDGNHFALGKAEIKYQLINRSFKFASYIKNYEELPFALYLTSYYDIGYVKNDNAQMLIKNIMPNNWQYGTGIGLNAVMYYDYCLRIEYSINKQETQRFYVSFIASM